MATWSNPEWMPRASRLMELRGRLGWSRERLADLTGVSAGLLQQYECGRADIRRTWALLAVRLFAEHGIAVDEQFRPLAGEGGA